MIHHGGLRRRGTHTLGVGRRLAALAPSVGLAGCHAGAPSLSLVGAYFPAWILCSVVGLAAGLVAWAVLAGTRRAETVAYPLVLCIAIGAIAGLMAWQAYYRG